MELLFGEMEELAGQRNAIDSRLVEIAAEIEGDGIWGGATGGVRSVPALVAWKLGDFAAQRGDDGDGGAAARGVPPPGVRR